MNFATTKRRLTKLADFLDELPRWKFDFSTWFSDDWRVKDCGTKACALGWATTIPSFRKAGLRRGFNYANGVYPTYEGRGNDPICVAADFFGILDYEAERLFTPKVFTLGLGRLPDRATPKQVSKEIRKFLKEKETSRGTK